MSITAGLNAQPAVKKINLVIENQRNAWNEGDLKAYMAGYWHSDSLVFIGKSGPKYGWENTLNNYLKSYPNRNAMGHLDFGNLKVELITNKCAFVRGSWKLTRTNDTLSGYFTLIFKKIKGKWVIVSDHSS
jgi:ketosteroid isomerase-like protein